MGGTSEPTLAVLPMTDVPVKPKEQTGRSQRACLLCFLSTFTVAISIYLVYDLSLGSFSNEFVKMDSGCPITAVFHRAHDRTQSKVTSCYDEYIFEFAWCKDSDACLPSAAPPTTVSDTTPSSNQTLDARLRAAWPDAESGHTDSYTEVRRLRAWRRGVQPGAARDRQLARAYPSRVIKRSNCPSALAFVAGVCFISFYGRRIERQ